MASRRKVVFTFGSEHGASNACTPGYPNSASRDDLGQVPAVPYAGAASGRPTAPLAFDEQEFLVLVATLQCCQEGGMFASMPAVSLLLNRAPRLVEELVRLRVQVEAKGAALALLEAGQTTFPQIIQPLSP